jgi:hypothetical protein
MVAFLDLPVEQPDKKQSGTVRTKVESRRKPILDVKGKDCIGILGTLAVEVEEGRNGDENTSKKAIPGWGRESLCS